MNLLEVFNRPMRTQAVQTTKNEPMEYEMVPTNATTRKIAELKAEIARLKEKYEPKPVELFAQVLGTPCQVEFGVKHNRLYDNLKLTFTDGVLTGAEVLG